MKKETSDADECDTLIRLEKRKDSWWGRLTKYPKGYRLGKPDLTASKHPPSESKILKRFESEFAISAM
jgi:hypothetical protein